MYYSEITGQRVFGARHALRMNDADIVVNKFAKIYIETIPENDYTFEVFISMQDVVMDRELG